MQDIDFDALDQEVARLMDQRATQAQTSGPTQPKDLVNQANQLDVNTSNKVTASAVTIRTKSSVKAGSVKRVAGRNMDIINTHPVRKAKGSVIANSAVSNIVKTTGVETDQSKAVMARASSKTATFQDIRPRPQASRATSAVKPISRRLRAATVSTQPTQAVPASVASGANKSSAVVNLPSREVLRQRRRLDRPMSVDQTAILATNQSTMRATGDAKQISGSVLEGHHQYERLATRQPDGTETVYQRGKLDYVTPVTTSSANRQLTQPMVARSAAYATGRSAGSSMTKTESAQKALAMRAAEANHTNNISHERPMQAQSKPAIATAVVDLNQRAELQEVTAPRAAAIVAERSERDKIPSPFLETAKVNKRPLGSPAPYGAADLKATTINPGLSTEKAAREISLYRGDAKLSEEPVATKRHSVIWILLTILVIIGAAVGIYLMTVYNK